MLRAINAILTLEDRDLTYIIFRERCRTLVGLQVARSELQTSYRDTQMMQFVTALLDWVTVDERFDTTQE